MYHRVSNANAYRSASVREDLLLPELPQHTSDNRSPAGLQLSYAVAREDVSEVQSILRQDRKLAHFRDAAGNTVLHLATKWNRQLSVIDTLLDARADPALTNADGDTCMHIALARRPPLPELPQRLLGGHWWGGGPGLGALANCNRHGKTAVMLAHDGDRVVAGYDSAVAAVQRALSEWQGARLEKLKAAVERDDAAEVLELVIRTQWDPRAVLCAPDHLFSYALSRKARRVSLAFPQLAQDLSCTELLNQPLPGKRLPPLAYVTEGGDMDMMKALLDAGADPDQCAPGGTTSLHIAAAKGYEAGVALLLSHCALPDKSDAAGSTAAIFAAQHGHPGVIAVLRQADVNLHARDSHGHTALWHACRHGHFITAMHLVGTSRCRQAPEASRRRLCCPWNPI